VGKITLSLADKLQSQLLVKLVKYNKKTPSNSQQQHYKNSAFVVNLLMHLLHHH
jgi:hypothetical protein